MFGFFRFLGVSLAALAVLIGIGGLSLDKSANARVAPPSSVVQPVLPATTCDFTVLNFNMSGSGDLGASRPISVTAGDTFEQFIAPPITATASSQAFSIVNNGYSGSVSGGVSGSFVLTDVNSVLVTSPQGFANPRGFGLHNIVINGAGGTITAALALNFVALTSVSPYYPQAFNGYLHSIATTGTYAPYKFNGTIAGTIFQGVSGLNITASVLGRLYSGGGALNDLVGGVRSVPPNRATSFQPTDVIAQFHLPDFAVGAAAPGHVTARTTFVGTTSGTVSGAFAMDHNVQVPDSGPNSGKGWLVGEFSFTDTGGNILTGPWLSDVSGSSVNGYVWQVVGTGIYTDSLLFGTINGVITLGGTTFAGTMSGVYCEGSVIPTSTPLVTATSSPTPASTGTAAATATGPAATDTPAPATNTASSTPTSLAATLTSTPTFSASLTSTPATPTSTVSPTPECPVAWWAVPSANVNGCGSLVAVSGVSAADIWAVGYSGCLNSTFMPIAQHWDGQAWSVVPVPPTDEILIGVAAVASDDVWAVGGGDMSESPLVDHWDGHAWTTVQTTVTAGSLEAIAALSPTDIWAVGIDNRVPGTTGEPLILHWDGNRWNEVANSAQEGGLYGLAALAPNNVWAVGFTGFAPNPTHTLIEHWDGTSWQIVASPNPNPAYSLLADVDAAGPDDIWAVGSMGQTQQAQSFQTLILHWDGTAWQQVASPSPDPGSTLQGVTAISSNDIWAVGSVNDYNAYLGRPLTLHWDGVQWTERPSINPGGNYSALFDVTGLGSNNVWAVGNQVTLADNRVQTLVEHYSNTPSFRDVLATDYFQEAVTYLACHGAISGYADGTFRPFNNTTRGQLSKIVVLAEGWTINTSGGPHFSDVLPSNPFYDYIETAYHQGVISGYADGTFKWGNNVTRAQLCKIVVLAEQWTIDTTGGPHFIDVPPTDPFYGYIETAYHHGIISGYNDGTFRPGNYATRGQISKIVYNAVVSP